MATAKQTQAQALESIKRPQDPAKMLEELLLKTRLRKGVTYTFTGTGKNGLKEGRKYKVSAVVAAVLMAKGIIKLDGGAEYAESDSKALPIAEAKS